MTESPFRIRKTESEGPRGGVVTMWQTYDTRRELDSDGGWCQTYATKSEARVGLAWLNAETEESTK